MLTFGILLLLVYIAGSINFAILILKMIGREDPRTQFSGNAGTTNVYRQAGLGWATIVLLLDLGRAAAIAGLTLYLLPAGYVPWIGFSLIVGNRFPCFHQFQGGKGVASFLGFTLTISPVSTTLAALLWVAVFGIVRIPFIASFFMILALAIGTVTVYNHQAAVVAGTVASALLIFYNHKRNLVALITERKNKYENQGNTTG
jgi:acyl phosphate:glycerol-3-phosphate acyltransferase